MQVNNEYLQCLGVGLQGLRASGQFCDAMVCVGSTRILVHKVVLSAASKTLHDLALEFDMTPHRERDQLEIIIPPDVSLYAVNMFINFIYTGQMELDCRVVNHIERLASLFGVTQLLTQCQEYIQKNAPPDSQNLNLRPENQIEPDSSINGVYPAGGREERSISAPDDNSQDSNLSRSNSVCSAVSGDLGNSSVGGVFVKMEPVHLASYELAQSRHSSLGTGTRSCFSNVSLPENLQDGNKNETSMSMLEKLMSPVVNLKKLPSNITPETIVMVSDDESDDVENNLDLMHKAPAQYSLEEKEAIAIEAKRYGTTQVANTRSIPLPDILSWMTLFGLRNPSNQRHVKHGKQVNHEADLSLVRWIVQQQEMNGCVNLNSMKQYALTVHQQTNPKFCASKTWLGNFLQRNMSVLQGTKFVQGDKGDELDIYGNSEIAGVKVKQEVFDSEANDKQQNDTALEALGEHSVPEDIPSNEHLLLNQRVETVDNDDDNIEDDTYCNEDSVNDYTNMSFENKSVENSGPNLEMIKTPFGKRPIIIGQSKAFDAKSERKIVHWVLERHARDGYVFTDDFKNYARSLYKGSKVFGATQAWMKKFLRRNRALKHVKFCSKFKNVYSTEDKVTCVAMAKKYGVSYAAKHTGINQKVIHCWKLAYDKGMLNVDQSALMKIESLCSSFPVQALSKSSETASTSGLNLANYSPADQAARGIVPAFEQKIVQEIKEFQEREGSINYNDISKISQLHYKETRPNFKASYNWVKSFLDRHKEALADIELENVSKVFIEDDSLSEPMVNIDSQLKNPKITEMVDQALIAIGDQGNLDQAVQSVKEKRPVVVGPSVMFDRKSERKLVEWALEKQKADGYVFTDDFKLFAKSVHTGPKNFSASSGWMTLFLRRHRVLSEVNWRSKYKNNYTEEEKMAAVAAAKRLGTGHVGRQLGIEPKLIAAWRFKMERNAPKQTFWKGTKIKKFGKGLKPRFTQIKHTALCLGGSDASRGIVPEFEQKIVDLILEEHQKEGSISYEEMSRLAQSVYKETRPTFKASYAWIRNFMKRNEQSLSNLNIDNVKKVFLPDDEENNGGNGDTVGNISNEEGDFKLQKIFNRRPIIVGQSRSLDTKTEKKLVQWTVEQQEKNGYVFLDQFKSYAQSLYKGEKKFAATQAWRVKFLRRNHAALKNVKFQSSFRNQYSLQEKKAIVKEAKKYGAAYVARTTGIEHCLINAWRQKLERMGVIPSESPSTEQGPSTSNERPNFASKLKQIKDTVGPGLYSYRGIVPAFEQKIVTMIMNKMDDEGSVSYQDVSNFARAVYKETRPHFKASYNWIKDFIKRHKKELRHAEFEHIKRITHDDQDMEVIIPEDHIGNVEQYLDTEEASSSFGTDLINVEVKEDSIGTLEGQSGMDIVIDNPEDPNYESQYQKKLASVAKVDSDEVDIGKIVAKRPIIIGKAVHFNRKTEKLIVEWLMETQNKEGFVFTDDFRRYARSLYTGPPEKFGATNAWIAKFLRRNRLEGKIEFQSKLKGNNVKFETKICDLIQEQQQKEGSVSHEDIQKITQSVYKETRPNFRACYGWIKDFLKRNQEKLVGVDLENVKKVYIPDEDEKDGVLIQNFDPLKSLPYMDTSSSSFTCNTDERSNLSFSDGQSHDSSWFDLESSVDLDSSRSQTNASPRSVLDKLASQKRPVIIGPPRGMDSKTEKKIVHWMREQQEKDGCVYLDLFKQYAKSIHSGPKKFAATQAWMTKFKQRNHDALKNVVIKSRFRNEYSVEEKLKIVEQAKRLGCNHVGRQLGINGGVIYSWKVQLEQIDKLGGSGGEGFNDFDSLESSARGVVPEFENSIVRMVLETQRAKGSVTYEDVSVCARSVYKETRPHFKASTNWVMDFIRKYKEDFKEVNFENQRKFHSEEEKLHILSEEKKYGTDHVVKKRNISASTLYHWKRNMQAKAIPIPKYKAIVSSKIKKKYAKGKNVKTYSLEEKRNMVSVAEANGVTYAALKLGISRTMLGKWIRYFRDQGENIVINFTHSSTMKKELVQKIVAWVLEENDKLGIILTTRIIEQAKKVFEEAYTGFNATQNWLEGFLAQNSEKFENVRFRDAGDRDMDFSDEIKLKLSRYAEIHGAVETADLTGLQTKVIYHWRRNMKMKGYDLSADAPVKHEAQIKVEDSDISEEPKSLLQKKLDRVAAKYNTMERKAVVAEASVNGVSATASKMKLPLPLILQWMKMYLDDDDIESRSVSRSTSVSSEERKQDKTSQEKLKIRLPSIEKASRSSEIYKKHSKEFKKRIVEDARRFGVKQVCDREGLGNSTVYYWMKEERENSVDSSRDSVEKSGSSARSSLDKDLSTPILIKDIKKEPGLQETSKSSGTHTPSRYPYGQTQVKVVRKYTDEQKLEAAQRAHEIGHKQASIDLKIPLTNVKRWYDLYKSKIIGGKVPKVSPKSTSGAYREDKIGLLQDFAVEDRKRKAPETSPFSSYKRYKYTDEERIAFVKETEIIGTSAVAAKAGVSMDLVYRWRSKFLKGIKAERGAAESATDSTVNDESDSMPNSPQMPAPRNTVFDIATKDGMTIVDQRKSKDDPQFEYLGLSLCDSVNENSIQSNDIHEELDSQDISNDKQNSEIDFGTYESVNSGHNISGDNYHGHPTDLIEINDDSPPNVHTIDDIDIIAADQIMEMTSRYMEAEKEHERNPFGLEKETRIEKNDLDIEKSPGIIEDETVIEKGVDVSEKSQTEEEESSVIDTVVDTGKDGDSREAGMEMFKIVDIKSEASVNKS